MNNELLFISEQDGEVEREFKNALCQIFVNSRKPIRAYLALAQWQQSNPLDVFLCLRVPGQDDLVLLNQCAEVFKNMFAQDQHLDMIFIDEQQEQSLCKVCRPFYMSSNF